MATNAPCFSDKVDVPVSPLDPVMWANVGDVEFRDTLGGVRFTVHWRESAVGSFGWIVQHGDHRADSDGPAAFRSPVYANHAELNATWNALRKSLGVNS